MVAPLASSTMSASCHHGSPHFDSTEEQELYNEGLKDVLKLINKYIDKGSQSTGKKSAEKIKKGYPELFTLEMVHLLSATGVKLLLSADSRARLVVQALAEIIGKVENELKGYSTIENELDKSCNDSTGVKQASVSILKKFFATRVPCTCLQSQKSAIEEEMGTCSYEGCRERRQLMQLKACAACRSVTYCCAECQRVDWPVHSQNCQRLCRHRNAKLATEVSKENKEATKKEERQAELTDDDEGSLSTNDLALDGDNDSESSDSLGLDELMASLDSWMGQSEANLFPTSDEYKTKKKDKKNSSSSSKMHASTSVLPSHTELEIGKKKEKEKLKSKSKKASSDNKGKLAAFSSSFAAFGKDKKKIKKLVAV